MQNHEHQNDPTPPDCFRQTDVESFQSVENQILSGVQYFLWLDAENALPYRFLLALELLFESGESLLLSSGEDSEAIRVITAEALLETATHLQELHGKPIIQRMQRSEQGFWPGLMGKVLEAVRLSRHENGLYRNDALLLDFAQAGGVVIQLPESGEGLEILEL